MRTGYNHTKAVAGLILGLAIAVAVAAVFILWVYVEIAVGVSMLQIDAPFLGWAMLVIAASNVIGGLLWLGKTFL